ncbi:MAG TPA: hypothetical protein VHV10_11265 [Ktedonobacteraceae bacterium]|nr:hypothetical protein [Ktedonobacteraceae bacterium]
MGTGKGKIERMGEPGSTYGFYNAADVNALIHIWNKEALASGNPTLPGAHFDVATKEDMSEIVELLIKVWGGGDTSAKRNAWLDRNPESAFVVRSHGEVRGTIFILPLAEEKIWNLLQGNDRYATGDIAPEDILSYEVNKPAFLYLLSMTSDSIGVGETNRRKWGSTIVRGLFDHVIDLGKRGIPVALIASRSSKPDGINLMRHIGFTEIEPCGDRKNFIIDIKVSGIDFAMKHKAAYREWQANKSK